MLFSAQIIVHSKLDNADLSRVVYQLLCGVHHLHKSGIIHMVAFFPRSEKQTNISRISSRRVSSSTTSTTSRYLVLLSHVVRRSGRNSLPKLSFITVQPEEDDHSAEYGSISLGWSAKARSSKVARARRRYELDRKITFPRLTTHLRSTLAFPAGCSSTTAWGRGRIDLRSCCWA